jgi:hypothetical protein
METRRVTKTQQIECRNKERGRGAQLPEESKGKQNYIDNGKGESPPRTYSLPPPSSHLHRGWVGPNPVQPLLTPRVKPPPPQTRACASHAFLATQLLNGKCAHLCCFSILASEHARESCHHLGPPPVSLPQPPGSFALLSLVGGETQVPRTRSPADSIR